MKCSEERDLQGEYKSKKDTWKASGGPLDWTLVGKTG